MEDEYIPPDPPNDLGEHGRELWTSVVTDYSLNGAELHILFNACRQADLAEYMHARWVADGMPLETQGSRGQLVAHPFVTEIRQRRNQTAALLKSLKLPTLEDPEEEITTPGKMSRSESGRIAARARWDRARGGQSG